MTVKALFAEFVSVPVKLAEPVVAIVPMAVATKLIVTVMVCPPGSVEVRHVITPPRVPAAGVVHAPPAFAVADRNWNEEGSVVVKVTPLAEIFVLSLTCQVKVSDEPWVGPPFWAEPVT